RAGHADADYVHVLRRLGAGDLFEQDRLVRVGSAVAAVLHRPRQPRVALRRELPAPVVPRLLVGLLARARPGQLGRDVLFEPAARLVAEDSLFRGVAEIHRAYSTAASALRSRSRRRVPPASASVRSVSASICLISASTPSCPPTASA